MARKNQPATASSSDRAWEAQDALRTLTRAEEIRSNKKLMSDVKREAAKQAAVAQKVLGKKK